MLIVWYHVALSNIEQVRPADPVEFLAIQLIQYALCAVPMSLFLRLCVCACRQASTIRKDAAKLDELSRVQDEVRKQAVAEYSVKGRV